MQQKDKQTQAQNVEEKVIGSQTFQDVNRWSREVMDRKVGAIKPEFLRKQKLVPWVKCSFSGSEDEDFREYIVPRTWQRMTDADWKRFKVQVDGEATEEDLLNLRSTASSSGTAEQIAPQQTGEGDAQPTVDIDDSAKK